MEMDELFQAADPPPVSETQSFLTHKEMSFMSLDDINIQELPTTEAEEKDGDCMSVDGSKDQESASPSFLLHSSTSEAEQQQQQQQEQQQQQQAAEKGDRKLFRDDRAKNEECSGLISFMVVMNDDTPSSYRLLTGAKNIFQRQLPKMPKEYISRLVYDRRHKCLCIVRRDGAVLGAICYRLFSERGFLEIVFCAITSSEQVKGYGSFLMNRMKEQAKLEQGDIQHFLTYADNYAVGYFKKQGFSVDITLDRSIWGGYIKDYDGGTLMQCTLLPKVDYMNIYQMLHLQKQALLERIKEKSNSHIVHPGLDFSNGQKYDPKNIPGVLEAGWTEEMSKAYEPPKKNKLYEYLKTLLDHLVNHPDAWPFEEPVNLADVPDYLNVVKTPMDLSTMAKKIEEKEYTTLDEFVNDVNLIVENCKAYNAESTPYHKCALRLEASFKERLSNRKFIE